MAERDLDLIPQYLHDKVAGIEAPEYAGKLAALLEPGERVEHATMGAFRELTYAQSLKDARKGKPALLVITDRRFLAVYPQTKGLLGTKTQRAASASFAASDRDGNVWDGGVFRDDSSKVVVHVAGPDSTGRGAMIQWVAFTGDPDLGNLWATVIRDGAQAAGGAERRPNGL